MVQMAGTGKKRNDARAQRARTAKRVANAIESLLERGEPVTFYSVADRSQVARSTLYRRPDLREMIESAREKSQREANQQQELAQIEQRVGKVEKKLAALVAGLPRIEYAFVPF